MESSAIAGLRIVSANEQDVPLILRFICKLAEYEKLLDTVTADERSLRDSLFGARPAAEALLAYWGADPAGFAVFFHNFSTFAGRPGIYIEDVFVEPAHRGRGIGKALFTHIAKRAKERGCARVEWAVLDWNRPAIEFYRKLGAAPMDEWTIFRLGGEAIDRLADEDDLPHSAPYNHDNARHPGSPESPGRDSRPDGPQ
ncbi:MAG: GNAT family N-acetyltransferase [Bryobacteraceae bacterium]